MILSLHQLGIELSSNSEIVCQQWQQLFQGWLKPKASPVDVRLHRSLEAQFPPLPEASPYFSDAQHLP
ncbi:MAG: hypothetical protein KC413_17325, partial [Anaerolineales bacterium]|nr:hypothetical protein [Anaerolineales bacterium]